MKAFDYTTYLLKSAMAFGLLLVPATASAFDADHDGTKDGLDAYPCDADAVGAAFHPAQGDHGMIMFEDLWPVYGDKDFNDAVIAYNYIYKLDANGDVVRMRLTLNVMAIGAVIHSGLGLHLPVARSAVKSVTMSRLDKHHGQMQDETSVNLMVSQADAELTFRITNDLREFYNGFGGGVNTDPTSPREHGEVVEIFIDFWQPTTVPMNQAPYDMYLFRTSDPSHELHRMEYRGTAAMNTALFNTGNDGSSATRSFVSTTGLPFALVFPTLVPYPKENTPIESLYPNITPWAASGGTTNQNFYTTPVASAVYSDVNGRGAPAPQFIGPADLPAETGCIRDWGLAVEWGNTASRYAYGAVVNDNAQATFTGYTNGAIAPATNAGGRDVFVARHDTATGDRLWAYQSGSTGDDTGRDIATDSAGNVFIVGDVDGTFNAQTSAGGRDAFLMKLSGTGTVLWTRTFGGAGDETGYGIAVDSTGAIYIAGGSTSSSLPGATFPGNTPASFLVKYDTNGNRLWTQHYISDGGHGSNYSYALDVESDPTSMDVYVVGSERRFNESANAADNQYLARHSGSTGAIVWTRHVGGHGYRDSATDYRYAYGFGVAVDTYDGSAYVVGYWYGGNAISSWNGWQRGVGDFSPDGTIARYSSAGELRWQYALASADAGEDFAWGVVADGVGAAVYVTGRTSGAFSGQSNLGATDYFARAYSFTGTEQWTVQNGTPAFDSGHIAAVRPTNQTGGTVYVIGNSTAIQGDWGQWDILMMQHNAGNGALTADRVARRTGWVVGAPGTCSVTCGQGTAPRSVQCIRANGTVAPDAECSAEPHPGFNGVCIDYSFCSQSWATDVWSTCSTTCGTGNQNRNVYCRRDDGLTRPDYECGGEPRPADIQNCSNTTSCTYGWTNGTWSTCNATGCNMGTQARQVTCVRSDGAAVNDSFCTGAKPAGTQSCSGTCPATTCATLYAGGQTTSGRYNINPDGTATTLNVYCDMSNGGGWTNLDFANQRVVLQWPYYIQCTNGLTADATSVTCRGPQFNNDPLRPLYHYRCDGNDRSANYILDHIAPIVGLRNASSLGFSRMAQSYDGTFPASSGNREYCYVNGRIPHWTNMDCRRYSAQGNGSCTVSYFTLTR